MQPCVGTSSLVVQESFLNPSFLEIVRYCKSPGSSADRLLDFITEENRMLKLIFCCALIDLAREGRVCFTLCTVAVQKVPYRSRRTHIM